MTEQRIFRGRHKSNFSALSNGIWEDEKLSIEAKGTLGYLLSRPPNWHVRVAQVGKKLRIGRGRLYRIISELIEAGYLERWQGRSGDGVFKAMSYYVRDANVVPRAEKPHAAERYTDEPHAAKRHALIKKEDSTKKDSYKITSSTKPLPQTPSPIAPAAPAAAKRLGNERKARPVHQSVVQARLAERLGLGNAEAGWLIMGALTDSERESLTTQERAGRLTDNAIAEIAMRLQATLRKTENAA